jgi:hypothetical protein
MTQPQTFLSHGLIIEGIPITKAEFEKLTTVKAFRSESDVVYLKDVTLMGYYGKIAKVGFCTLSLLTSASSPNSDSRWCSALTLIQTPKRLKAMK